jgi:hypothetical protein
MCKAARWAALAAGANAETIEEEAVPQVRLERNLRLPAEQGAQVLGEILGAIARQEGPWRGFALHVGLGDLHFPDVGYVAIPIHLTAEKSAKEKDAFDIAFVAANLPGAFPEFRGVMGTRRGDLGECTLYLAGTYELPMQVLGRLIDATLTPGVAALSLENFISELAVACQARVDQREAEFARYRYYGRAIQ